MARQYGISYPTVRLRLDRLIQKVRLLEEAHGSGPYERRLRAAYADGRMFPGTFRALLDAYLKERRRAQGEALRRSSVRRSDSSRPWSPAE